MTFRDLLAESAERGGPIILAADIPYHKGTVPEALSAIEKLAAHICAVKVNFHVLLPLGTVDIKKITDGAHARGLQCIADIKLNDIGSTNEAASDALWQAGFDALIANPIMGPEALSALVGRAHRRDRGVVSLCHMSSREGAASYEMQVNGRPLYQTFLEWGLAAGVDGIIAGATFPDVIRGCRQEAGDRLDILSPGIGVQGGSAQRAFASGTDYIIVGRSLLNSENPAAAARSLLP